MALIIYTQLDPIYLSSSPQSFFPPLLYTSVKIGSLLAKKKVPKNCNSQTKWWGTFFCSFPQASMLVSQILSCYRLPVVSIFLRLHNWLRAKVIIEKSRTGRFLWNGNWDLGWIWADWQYCQKRTGLIMSNFWGWFLQLCLAQIETPHRGTYL